METTLTETTVEAVPPGNLLPKRQVCPEMLASAAVQRLLEEVRCDGLNERCVAGKYDRTHNRHNR